MQKLKISKKNKKDILSNLMGRYLKIEKRSLSLSQWATCKPDTLNSSKPAILYNLLNGQWKETKKRYSVIDPLNGDPFILAPDTSVVEVQPFIESLRTISKSGLHNPLKNPERYIMYGKICQKVATELRKSEVENFFVRCIQRTMPKSYLEASMEVRMCQRFLETFSGDAIRFMARSFSVPGDHNGQESRGYRWPYGPVAIVTPFNFPFKIPVLQLMGSLFMGNKPIIKSSPQVSLVLEQFIRLLLHCGMPNTDVDFFHGGGLPMEKIILDTPIAMTQFTGSASVAEKLLHSTKGKMKIEDAGLNWKIIGSDVSENAIDYISWVSDQDAYACSGQRCNAQSLCFVHENVMKMGFIDKIKSLAERRSLNDLTISPLLSWTNEKMLAHIKKVLQIPGSKLLFGGKILKNNKIPDCYGAFEPTAIYIPIKALTESKEFFNLLTVEIFGPFQIIVEYNDSHIDDIIYATNNLLHHLSAAVVSSDPEFLHKIISNTVNGTTYAGIRARTCGAPPNHWFGPARNPSNAGIGTPEAICHVWSYHREIIHDVLLPASDWVLPNPS